MKNILKLSFIVFASLLVSCSEDYYDSNFPRDVESGWIQFGRAAQTIDSDIAELNVPVNLQTSVNRNDVTVTVSAELLAGELSSEFLQDRDVLIQAGTLSSPLTLNFPIDEFAELEPVLENNIVIRYTLVSSSSSSLPLGLPDSDTPITFTLTISFGCEIDIPLTYAAESFIGANLVTSFTMELTEGEEDGEFFVESLWGPDFVADATGNPDFSGQFVYPGSFIILCDDTIEIVGPGSNGLSGGEGTIDPETNEMEFVLNQGLFTQDFQVIVVLTPQ